MRAEGPTHRPAKGNALEDGRQEDGFLGPTGQPVFSGDWLGRWPERPPSHGHLDPGRCPSLGDLTPVPGSHCASTKQIWNKLPSVPPLHFCAGEAGPKREVIVECPVWPVSPGALSCKPVVGSSFADLGVLTMGGIACCETTASAQSGLAELPIVDTHEHLWDLSKFRLPWLKSGEPLCRSYLPKDYQEAGAGLKIVKSVYMEVDMEVDMDPADEVAEAESVIAICRGRDANVRGGDRWPSCERAVSPVPPAVQGDPLHQGRTTDPEKFLRATTPGCAR